MSMLRLYTRVLELLGKEARLGWILAGANLLLAGAQFAAIMSLVVMLPLALYINWRLAVLLFVLCVVFTVLTTLVVRKTYGMQSEVEAHYSDLSARASDALGNVALVQSFVRIDAEVQGLRFVADKLLAVQMPVLGWWALVTVITRASTTITVLAIFTDR